ncbi:phage structural protein [Streptococcus suis]|uniref:Phage structural protein n=2 Tax=Streptococcus suis TaxID=1307 RepID=A0A0Z8FL99_STRSU|nr:phage structural protein [Streptococcus suis]CYU82270.1 phage structural protein [Streptococcus suis]
MDAGWNIEFGNTYGNTVTVTCDGQSQTLAVGPLYLNGSKKYLGSVQFRVGHNADGTKSAGIGLNSNMSNISYGTLNFGNASGNWVHGLTTIPRSSSVSVSPGVIGSALTININRQSSSFKHIVRYAWGNKSGTIATNVDTSTTWTIPLDFANDIPNSTSGTGTIYVDTYSGSTKTGTQQVAFIANVPASMKPTFSGVTLTDTNGAARSLLSGNNFLQIISNIQVNFNGASGSYSSTITGYKAEIVNRNQVTNSNGGMLGIMNFSGSATIRASVVDSRGRWSDTRDVTINVIEYFAPVLSFTAQRTRQTPNIIQIARNAKIASITLSGSQKNIMTLSFKVAPLGSASYTADNGSASGSWTTQHTLNNSPANMAGSYPANKSFTIIGTLSDKFTSVEFSATVATESVVMSYDKDGRVGVGKIAENGPAGSLDVAGNIYAGGKQIQQYQLTNVEGNTIYAYNTDVNTHVNNGIRWINPNCANSPFPSQYGWIETCRATTDIFQVAKSWYGGWKVYRRHAIGYKSSNGSATWYPWVEITPQTNHTNLINTGWQSAGYPGTYYKRVGDVLTIKYDFTGNGSTMNIGSIPSDIWVAPQSYMLVIAKWSISGSDNSHVQINQGTGALNVLSTGNGIVYRGQLTIMI